MGNKDTALDAAAVKKTGDAGAGGAGAAGGSSTTQVASKSLEEQLAEAQAALAASQGENETLKAQLAKGTKEAKPLEPVELKEPDEYIVTETTRMSWGGQDVTFTRNQIVSEASYGPGSIERMKDSGVKLELKPKAKK